MLKWNGLTKQVLNNFSVSLRAITACDRVQWVSFYGGTCWCVIYSLIWTSLAKFSQKLILQKFYLLENIPTYSEKSSQEEEKEQLSREKFHKLVCFTAFCRSWARFWNLQSESVSKPQFLRYCHVHHFNLFHDLKGIKSKFLTRAPFKISNQNPVWPNFQRNFSTWNWFCKKSIFLKLFQLVWEIKPGRRERATFQWKIKITLWPSVLVDCLKQNWSSPCQVYAMDKENNLPKVAFLLKLFSNL